MNTLLIYVQLTPYDRMFYPFFTLREVTKSLYRKIIFKEVVNILLGFECSPQRFTFLRVCNCYHHVGLTKPS